MGEVDLSSQELMRISFEKIRESDLVVLEMSEKGGGQAIEAGYAVATKKPLIVLIRHGIELSSSMEGVADAVIVYSDPTYIKISAHDKGLHPDRIPTPDPSD
jgi:nucleoside 2-deoxyribosyltransferase